MERASWIRRMFEEGIRLRQERGAENVFDFTLGNPDVEPPEAVIAALRRVVAENRPRSNAYMPNAGFPAVRQVMARRLAERTGLDFTEDDVLMTVGAAGAINTLLKAILDPGDEVIVLNPYFPEYRFFIQNHAGGVPAREAARLAAPITPRTKAIILNSPNNPTGAIYPEAVLRELNGIVRDPVIAISDEPYRPIVFDPREHRETLPLIERSALAWSWSKAMAVAGERIGYLALSPRLRELAQLRSACTFTNRILGYIKPPALWQWVVAEVPGATVDVAQYQAKRDRLSDALTAMGYHAPRPQGSFYCFPRTPIADDVAFIRRLQKEGILAVPGSGFGRGGFMRLSLTIRREDLERSLTGFERALRQP